MTDRPLIVPYSDLELWNTRRILDLLLSRFNFDGMDPNSFTVGELRRAATGECKALPTPPKMDLRPVYEALAFFKSAILCGDGWTQQCEEAHAKARAVLSFVNGEQ